VLQCISGASEVIMPSNPNPGRRRWLAGASALAAACAAPSLVRAQGSAPARVGWLHLRDKGPYAELTHRGLLAGLQQGGYVEGRNLVFVHRSADGQVRRLRALAREIVAEKVDVFFAPAKPMADAAWYASRTVPTVIATVTDPVVVDYAVSLARPGKQITGVTTANAELIGKRLQLLTELVPGLERVGTPIEPALLDACSEEVDRMKDAARRLKLTLVQLPVKTDEPDVERVVQEAARQRAQALVTAPMTSNLEITDQLAAACGRARLPFVHDIPQFAGDSLAVYGPDFEDIFRRAAGYIVRILKGEKPAEMAIEEPRDFKLIVNQRQARLLGLTVPQSVLLRADQVIA
jgi:putative ABC transport system substrate-binding protein